MVLGKDFHRYFGIMFTFLYKGFQHPQVRIFKVHGSKRHQGAAVVRAPHDIIRFDFPVFLTEIHPTDAAAGQHVSDRQVTARIPKVVVCRQHNAGIFRSLHHDRSIRGRHRKWLFAHHVFTRCHGGQCLWQMLFIGC